MKKFNIGQRTLLDVLAACKELSQSSGLMVMGRQTVTATGTVAGRYVNPFFWA
jgi:hypothetical protein